MESAANDQILNNMDCIVNQSAALEFIPVINNSDNVPIPEMPQSPILSDESQYQNYNLSLIFPCIINYDSTPVNYKLQKGGLLIKTEDNIVFSLSKLAVRASNVLKNYSDDMYGDYDFAAQNENDIIITTEEPTPIQITSSILNIILAWIEFHIQFPFYDLTEAKVSTGALNPQVLNSEDYKKEYRNLLKFDKDLLENNFVHLGEIEAAARYLDIQKLCQICYKYTAQLIIGKTPEEIRQKFNLIDDFTPEEKKIFDEQNKDFINLDA
jgi:hypothetical protein